MSEYTPQSARAVFWRKQIEAWRASGQSQRAFCKRRALSHTQFQYWRRKLSGATADSGSETARSGFVAVRIPPPEDAATELTVVLPNGAELRGIHAGNLEVVERLLGLGS